MCDEKDGWRTFALCAEVDPEIFFPGSGGDARPALRVCRDCPVMMECRAWGDDEESRKKVVGILGGETATQRIERRKGTHRKRRSRGLSRPDKCVGCGRPLRSSGVSAAEAPGTVSYYGHDRCTTCWRHVKRG